MLKTIRQLEDKIIRLREDYTSSSLPARMAANALKEINAFRQQLGNEQSPTSVTELSRRITSYYYRILDSIKYLSAKEQHEFSIVDHNRTINYDSNYCYPAGCQIPVNVEAYEVVSPRSSLFADSILSFYSYFPFSEIDPPSILMGALDRAYHGDTLVSHSGTDPFYSRYLLVVLIDKEHQQLRAAIDGAVLARSQMPLVYGAHIWVHPDARMKGLGRVLEGAFLSCAHQYVQEAERVLDVQFAQQTNAPNHYSMVMLVETEFPSLSPIDFPDSLIRLIYHARTGKRIIWPLVYAQPDTDYHENTFRDDLWYPVPMFLATRLIGEESCRTINRDFAIAAANLMFDSCTRPEIASGIEKERAHMDRLTPHIENIDLIKPPQDASEVRAFMNTVGEARTIMSQYYQGYHFVEQWINARQGFNDIDINEAIRRLNQL